MTAHSQLELRKAFGTFMTGVTVVTTYTGDGVPVGFTANSFTSVSLDPPLVLVCPSKALTSLPAFDACSHFAINILSEDQQDVANVFARPVEDRFSHVKWRDDSLGSPVFEGVTASFSCSVHNRVSAGDHQVLIGRVDAFDTYERPGLGYANGGYFSLGLERFAAELPRASRASHVGAIIEYKDQVLLARTSEGWRPPEVEIQRRAGSRLILRDRLQQSGIDLQFGPVYSVFENKRGEYSTYYRCYAHDNTTNDIGEYVPIAELDQLDFATHAIADMMKRWVLERQHGVFRLFVGDELDSDIHPFTDNNSQQTGD